MTKSTFTRRQFSLVAGALAVGRHGRTLAQASVNEPYVVDAAWLQARRASDPNVVLLDASAPRTYATNHIVGAVHCWWQDTMEWNNVVYGTTLATGGATARAQLLKDLGIDDTVMVVAYDNENGIRAARMVWFLRWLNHRSAAMLDGGLVAWQAASGAVESGSNDAARRGTPSIKPQASLLMSTKGLQARLTSGKSQIVDVRTESEAHDTVNGASKLGRIPTSIAFPWTSAITNHQLKTRSELSSLLSQSGISPTKEVVLYGRYGVEAGHTWVVMKSLGLSRVTIYDPGFVGWQTDLNHPIDPLPFP